MSKLKKQAEKQARKKPWYALLLIVILAFGGVGGFFGAKFLTRNDTFEINGDQEVVLEVGDYYVEKGATIISFGRDISKTVKIDSTVDTTTAGQYYVKYTVEDIRFGNVERYRYVTVVEVANEG
jgi:hypothetical protein